MPGPTIYQYRPEDTPVTLADQFGVTPQQLIQANPGGFPFSVGQQIRVPTFQYSAPIGPNPAVTDPGRGTMLPSNPMGSVQNANLAMRGRGYQPPGTYAQSEQGVPASTGYGTDDSWYRTTAQANAAAAAQQRINQGLPPPNQGPTGNLNNGYGGFQNKGGADNTDFNQTAAAQYNAANNIPFLNQKRWDPKRRKYITVGQWLKQNRRGGRGRGARGGGGSNGGGGGSFDAALANSIIDFGVSAG